ncbi:MAG: hypothetical protein JXR76_19475 [Deltaproteobacteria bacterium]|nr:hypothetical protein [Deltaproteobacteria bacterium]
MKTEILRKRRFRILAVVLLFALALPGCCEKADLEMGRFDGFASGVLDFNVRLRADAHFSATVNGSLSGSLSFEGWSDISWFTPADLGIDISAGAIFNSSPRNANGQLVSAVRMDMDNDAYDETVYVLKVIEPSGNTRWFYQWKGDKYTLDKGVTYLGWTERVVREGQSVGAINVVSADSVSEVGAIKVTTFTNGAPVEYVACQTTQNCGYCTAETTLDDCLDQSRTGNFSSPAPAAFGTMPAEQLDTGTDVSTDTTKDSASDSENATDTDTSQTGNSDTGTEFNIDLDSDSNVDITISVDSETSISIGGGIDIGGGIGF